MGTRSLTTFVETYKDNSGKKVKNEIVTMYRQYDGYMEGHGKDLADFLAGGKLVNGIGMDEGSQVGYCNKLDFTCAAENVCSEWGKGGPVTDFSDIDIHEPLEGNEKDIF